MEKTSGWGYFVRVKYYSRWEQNKLGLAWKLVKGAQLLFSFFFMLAKKALHVGVQPEGAFYTPKAWCHARPVGRSGLVQNKQGQRSCGELVKVSAPTLLQNMQQQQQCLC